MEKRLASIYEKSDEKAKAKPKIHEELRSHPVSRKGSHLAFEQPKVSNYSGLWVWNNFVIDTYYV